MQTNQLYFQLATHFLSKTSLKLESMFSIIAEASQASNTTLHRYALKVLIDILEITKKPELKSRFLKEFIRIEHLLEKSDTDYDHELAERLNQQIHMLNQLSQSFAVDAETPPFLQSIRQIYQSNSKDCEFHASKIVSFLNLPAHQRQRAFANWLYDLRYIQQTVDFYLSILRKRSSKTEISTENGYYQYSLPTKPSCHLIQLSLKPDLCYIIPDLHLGHHGLSIRLYDMNTNQAIKNKPIEMNIYISQF